jgi:hypothetical protein
LRLINPAIFLFKTKRPGVGHSKWYRLGNIKWNSQK